MTLHNEALPPSTDLLNNDAGDIEMVVEKSRRPVEAIEQRTRRSIECEQRVRKALAKLTKTGAPFTVENVCDLAGVGKTFISTSATQN